MFVPEYHKLRDVAPGCQVISPFYSKLATLCLLPRIRMAPPPPGVSHLGLGLSVGHSPGSTGRWRSLLGMQTFQPCLHRLQPRPVSK